jgi:hypothetical protein
LGSEDEIARYLSKSERDDYLTAKVYVVGGKESANSYLHPHSKELNWNYTKVDRELIQPMTFQAKRLFEKLFEGANPSRELNIVFGLRLKLRI